MKKQYPGSLETIYRESYTLVNKALLSEPKKYIINKKIVVLFLYLKRIQDSIVIFLCLRVN